jgi:hypothetical protein
MKASIRDFIAALAAPMIATVVTDLTTSLPLWAVASVFVGTLIICVLIIAGLHALGRNLEAWKAAIVAASADAATAAMRVEVDARLSGIRETARNVRADATSSDTIVLPSLGRLLVDGRELRAGILGTGEGALIPAEIAVKIARWEALCINVLADWPQRLDEFKRSSSEPYMHEMTGFTMYNRMTALVGEIELAIRHPTDPW